MIEITQEMYRKALHIYLIHAYPGDDEMYYSRWAWLVPNHSFFDPDQTYDNHIPKTPPRFPREARFGCHCSGNTKLRCYTDGFMFDTNHCGDPEDIITEVKHIRDVVEADWRQAGIPVHGDTPVEGRGTKAEPGVEIVDDVSFEVGYMSGFIDGQLGELKDEPVEEYHMALCHKLCKDIRSGELIKNLSIIYADFPSCTARVCDIALDKSGRMLGEVRRTCSRKRTRKRERKRIS